ncbi:hypothetical protein [uncultured Marivita sp.]|uniref:DUF6927 domain-containing protein n=1 Tax=uncultured Marivita sp. TaxID=888080 RepID=UPI0022CA4F9E|nr:hypothetical protein [uncultured Marivita sp.]MCZ4354796.1 hypothetical protein [Roseovarius aestuarii]
MGWTCHYTPPSDERAEIEQLVTFENEDRAMRPVFTTRKGSVWYLAVEVTAKTTDADPHGYEADALGRYVFAAVILTRRDNGEWCYKDMEESMGPHEAQAPQKLLDLLSPTTKEYALAWRERCKAFAALSARKIAHGDTIRLAEPLEFSDGIARDTFTVQRERFAGARRATTHFLCQKTGAACRISRFMQRAWVKV